MAPPSRTVFDLLHSLERDGLCRLDLGLFLAIEELLRSGSHDTPEALAAAIASVCARDAKKWSVIRVRALEYLGDLNNRNRASLVEVVPSDEHRLPTGVIDEALNRSQPTRRGYVLVVRLAIVVGLLVALLGVLSPVCGLGGSAEQAGDARNSATGARSTSGAGGISGADDSIDESEASADTTSSADITTSSGKDSTSSTSTTVATSPGTDSIEAALPDGKRWQFDVVESTPQRESERRRYLRLLLVALLSAALTALGIRLLFAPGIRRLLADLRRDEAVGDSEGIRVHYVVERYLPFDRWLVDTASEALARRQSADHGSRLDVDMTIDATIRSDGRIIPQMEPGHAPQSLVVLVSREAGYHPMLDPVEAILDRWRETGLSVRRFDFGNQIKNLERHGDRTKTTLDALARRSEGSPLLIFARSTLLRSKHGGRGWLRSLRAWPCRALIDLDPRVESELNSDDKKTRRALDRSDLRRFAFTARGFDAMARYLASEGQVTARVEPEPLPPLPEIAPQLRRWAYCLACVPDLSWAQLEVFRRIFLKGPFEGKLDDFRVIARLLEWLRADLKQRGLVAHVVHGSGYGINLAEQTTRDYFAKLWEEDRDHSLEDACHELLLVQLRAAQPTACLDRLEREAKILEHEYLLVARDPARAKEALAKFDRFIGTVAERFVREILSRHAARFAAAGRNTSGSRGINEMVDRLYRRPLTLSEALGDREGWRASHFELGLGLTVAVGNVAALISLLAVEGSWRTLSLVFEVTACMLALGLLARRLRSLVSAEEEEEGDSSGGTKEPGEPPQGVNIQTADSAAPK